MLTVTERLLHWEQKIDGKLYHEIIDHGFMKEQVLYRGFRVAMIPAVAVACIVDLALGILANIVRLTGLRHSGLNRFARKHASSAGRLPALVFEQCLRFLKPSTEINELYTKTRVRITPQMIHVQSTWVERNLIMRIVVPILSVYGCLMASLFAIRGLGYGAWAVLHLGRDEKSNEQAINDISNLKVVPLAITEAVVTVLRLPF